jgi:hypothetical protein
MGIPGGSVTSAQAGDALLFAAGELARAFVNLCVETQLSHCNGASRGALGYCLPNKIQIGAGTLITLFV